MADNDPDLSAAYALQTPDDNRQLYAQWAESYDQSFAQDMDYQMPRLVALIYAEVGQGQSPVLDVGAGTGLLVSNMPSRDGLEIDALDISAQMLEVAKAKGLYRATIEADLTKTLEIEDGVYHAIVSSGTFTHGHVGPEALDGLMRIAKSGAVFVLAINKEHFQARGFAAKFAQLEPHIQGLELRSVQIYGADAKGDHKDDQALVAVFFKK